MPSPQGISRLSAVREYLASYAPRTTLPGITLATVTWVAKRALAHIPKVSEWAVSKLGTSAVRKLSGFSVAGFCIGVVSLLALNMASYRRLIPQLEQAASEAASRGDVAQLELLVSKFGKKILMEARFGSDKDTIAHIAAKEGHKGVLDWIGENLGTDFLKELDIERMSIAHSAANANQTGVLDWIAENGNLGTNFLKQLGDYSISIAHGAAIGGHVPALEWMAENGNLGTDFLRQLALNNESIAHAAAIGGHVPALEWMAENGNLGTAFLKQLDKDHWSIAHNAANANQTGVLDWIAENENLGSAFLKQLDKDRWSIAHAAAKGGHENVLNWIRENLGEDFLEQANNSGETAHQILKKTTQNAAKNSEVNSQA